jgi:RNA polymerase sigma factor (sigma-70 family)
MPFAAPIARALLRSQSDERLVRVAQEGHEGAFEEIVRRYRVPLVAFAAAYAPSERAEDVVQESLTKAWQALEASSGEIALKPWLYTIVRNRALNARRDARYHDELNEGIDGVPRPDQIVLEREELSRAVAAVTSLPEPQRKALIASAIEGRTHEQIAAELKTSASSVRGLVHRGRVAARGAMGAAVPLPVVGWAAGAGGTSVAGGIAAGSLLGGSLASKGAAAAVIAALAAGSGIVVERSLKSSEGTERARAATGKEDAGEKRNGPRDDRPGGPGREENPGRNDDAARGDDDDPGDDDEDDDERGDGPETRDSRETPETPETPDTPDTPDTPETAVQGGSSGSGSSGSDSGSSGSGSSGSGSGSSGSGSSGSGSSGSGSSGGGTVIIPPDDSDFDDPVTNTNTTGD